MQMSLEPQHNKEARCTCRARATTVYMQIFLSVDHEFMTSPGPQGPWKTYDDWHRTVRLLAKELKLMELDVPKSTTTSSSSSSH